MRIKHFEEATIYRLLLQKENKEHFKKWVNDCIEYEEEFEVNTIKDINEDIMSEWLSDDFGGIDQNKELYNYVYVNGEEGDSLTLLSCYDWYWKSILGLSKVIRITKQNIRIR